MTGITRPEVAHLARLARLELTDDELDHYAEQLDVILQAVARVSEVVSDDIPATSHPVPMVNVTRPDVETGDGPRRGAHRALRSSTDSKRSAHEARENSCSARSRASAPTSSRRPGSARSWSTHAAAAGSDADSGRPT